MLRITCPWCGERDHTEFTYGGDARRPRPAPDDASFERWMDYTYLRDNPCGVQREYWQHSHGCRQWLCVTRDVVTHEIIEVITARDHVERLRREPAA